MRKSKFTSQQISKGLMRSDNGKSVGQISREHGVSVVAFCRLCSKYKSMDGNELKWLKEFEEENKHRYVWLK
ncbi:transposase [Winogradskyella sp. UBA3174]|uniref:transposase n=1 Tax=Winogradskyella sp. UBA3174 TaxID=1947785 RepID=UPI0039C8DCBA